MNTNKAKKESYSGYYRILARSSHEFDDRFYSKPSIDDILANARATYKARYDHNGTNGDTSADGLTHSRISEWMADYGVSNYKKEKLLSILSEDYNINLPRNDPSFTSKPRNTLEQLHASFDELAKNQVAIQKDVAVMKQEVTVLTVAATNLFKKFERALRHEAKQFGQRMTRLEFVLDNLYDTKNGKKLPKLKARKYKRMKTPPPLPVATEEITEMDLDVVESATNFTVIEQGGDNPPLLVADSKSNKMSTEVVAAPDIHSTVDTSLIASMFPVKTEKDFDLLARYLDDPDYKTEYIKHCREMLPPGNLSSSVINELLKTLFDDTVANRFSIGSNIRRPAFDELPFKLLLDAWVSSKIDAEAVSKMILQALTTCQNRVRRRTDGNKKARE